MNYYKLRRINSVYLILNSTVILDLYLDLYIQDFMRISDVSQKGGRILSQKYKDGNQRQKQHMPRMQPLAYFCSQVNGV